MGLYPRKGAIQIGADADLAIIHPQRRDTITPGRMETNADWSPFEGWDLAGFARTTLSRGEVIVDDYTVVGREGRGQWLPRTSAGLAGMGGEPPAMRMSRGPLAPLRVEELEIAGAS
jgi:dihydropyrimidinase